MLLAEANQWPEDAAAYFGNGDECHMNFHFPIMPRMFMAIQMEDRFPIIDILRADARRSPGVPVGDVPAQPRRADAGDGDRRRARLHVPRVRGRPGDAPQPRHPPAPRAARRQRPAQDGAAQRPALLAAGHARPLLRRRDRHGRQRVPGRSQRRPHADAVELGPQRRLLAGQSPAAHPARRHRPRVPLRGASTSKRSRTTRTRSCGGPSGSSRCASGTRRSGAAPSTFSSPDNPRVLAFVRQHEGRDDPRRGQPLALRPVRRARSDEVPGHGADGALRAGAAAGGDRQARIR